MTERKFRYLMTDIARRYIPSNHDDGPSAAEIYVEFIIYKFYMEEPDDKSAWLTAELIKHEWILSSGRNIIQLYNNNSNEYFLV